MLRQSKMRYTIQTDNQNMNSPNLFDSIQLGALDLPSRIVMAPLTRARAGAERIPNALILETGNQTLVANEADAVAYGVLFIANPDLPKRFTLGTPPNNRDPQTFFASSQKGYTDYPKMTEED